MNWIEKFRWACRGSRWLSGLILAEAGIWVIVTILSLLGKALGVFMPIAEWLTLPSDFGLFLTRPWTLLSYMAVQFDFFHMLFNLAWLYWFGRILLREVSERQLAQYFIGGGIFGGAFFLIASSQGLTGGWLCGCSAAVIAVMTGAAVKMPDYRLNLLLFGEVKLIWVAVICGLLTFLGGGGNQTAHIGGLAWGLIMAVPLRFPSLRFKRQKGDRDPSKIVKILKDRQTDMQRLDCLLDKIRLSGYSSLSKRERKELNELSNRIKK